MVNFIDSSLNNNKLRLIYLLIPFSVFFIIITIRLLDLAIIGEYNNDSITTTPAARRPDIVDRNNIVIATNLPTYSLYANPKKIVNASLTTKKIISVLHDIGYNELYKLLTSKRSFVWIKRHLTLKERLEIQKLGLIGIKLQPDEKRAYPQGYLFSHIVGYVDTDNHGLSGIEKYLDEENIKDSPLKLTIDLRVQNVLRSELFQAVSKYSALGGTGIILDSKNGQIISMVSLPDFDLNNYAKATAKQRFNRATLAVYEMGSIFKLFTIASALDSNQVKIDDIYNVSEPLVLGKYKINDFHKSTKDNLSVQEIFTRSSNIGVVKIAMQMGKENQLKYLEKMRLFSELTIEIPERAKPILPKQWHDSTLATISYGYGVAVTPLHIAQAVAALVNNGIMYTSTLILNNTSQPRNIISAEVSQHIKKLLRANVRKGTGKKAEAEGYLVGGKTGSAEKVINGKYNKNANISSFVGVFPIHKPQYIILIVLDEPHNDKVTGGVIAAPIVKNIVNRIAPILNIMPVKIF